MAANESPSSETPTSALTKDDVKDQFVKYSGVGERIISADDWAAVGAKSQKDAVWGSINARRLPASDFSKAALNYLLEVDGEFVLED